MHVIEGTAGDDVLHGTRGRDCILAYGGDDTIYGEAGDDIIYAGSGDDTVYPGSGSCVVHAGSGNDYVDTSKGLASVVYGGSGQDTLIGGFGFDLFYGGADDDILKGGGGPDSLNGGGCNDLVIGGQFVDFVNGGRDFDVCDGEHAAHCERSYENSTSCASDSDCPSGESCASGSGFCLPSASASCGTTGGGCSATSSTDTSCDGVDDDCDGKVDDDYVGTPTMCGEGSCAATGMLSCVNGEVLDSCAPGAPLPNDDSTCDAQDDDCDGKVDEGFVPTVQACGVGVCLRVTNVSCMNGMLVNECVPGDPNGPTDTDCNGADDDCDGMIDDDVAPVPTHCGMGVCAATGMSSCQNGMMVDDCAAGDPTEEVDESCNGLDDDCNGVVDDAYVGQPTSCGTGTCSTTGLTSCVNGRVDDSCHSTCEGVCNDGADDDGDGVTDCQDPDCRNAVGCLPGSFGSPCINNSQCNRVGPEAFCVLGVPGGYCTRPCGSGCPDGTHCLADGSTCMVDCGPGDHCGREDFVCSPVAFAGTENDPFCHATCAFS
jgi:hypothetical protein